MYHVFQFFIDGVADSTDATDLRRVLAETGAALDLNWFAYLSLPQRYTDAPRLISTYPAGWTNYYLKKRYERVDPVIADVLTRSEPFEWGPDIPRRSLTACQRDLLDEAARFGIRYGFTVPIHEARGPIAAVTFATADRGPTFQRSIDHNRDVLQLMALYFHAHARRKLDRDHVVDGIILSPRQFTCLEWAAQGKSAWEIGQLLGISRRTAAFHLDNAKEKLGVRTICQAVARFSASKHALS